MEKYKVSFTFEAFAHKDLKPFETKEMNEEFIVSGNNQAEAFCNARYTAEKYARCLGYHGTVMPSLEDHSVSIKPVSQQELDAELEVIFNDPIFNEI